MMRKPRICTKLTFPAPGNPDGLTMNLGCLIEVSEQIKDKSQHYQGACILWMAFEGKLQCPASLRKANHYFRTVCFRGLRIGAELQATVHFGYGIMRRLLHQSPQERKFPGTNFITGLP